MRRIFSRKKFYKNAKPNHFNNNDEKEQFNKKILFDNMTKQQSDITITGQTFENFYQQNKNLCGRVKKKNTCGQVKGKKRQKEFNL